MTADRLHADTEAYRLAAAMDLPPPAWPPDPLVSGTTPIDQLLGLLGLAANAGDPADALALAEDHAEREAALTDAAGEFDAQDERAAAMAQQIPQLASGIAGAVAGALGGVLQPLGQLPAALAQGVGQALQTGAGVLSRTGRGEAGSADPLAGPVDPADLPGLGGDDEFDSGIDDVGYGDDDLGGSADLGGIGALGAGAGPGGALGAGAAGVAGSGAGVATGPAARLTPPAAFSPPTSPAAASSAPAAPSAPAAAGAPVGAGMAGIPMVPPMHGGAGADREPKPDTKRIAAPVVRNGAPVQGRLTAPPDAPVLTRNGAATPGTRG